MKITETTTFMGLFVSITSKSGMEYSYLRIAPNYWVYQFGGSADPYFSNQELETAYSEFLA